MKKILCVIPTLNAEKTIKKQIELLKQTKNIDILVIDSSSDDNTVEILNDLGIKVLRVDRKDFDHGGTRTLGAKYKESDIVVFLTQDALPYDNNSISNIVDTFQDNKIGAAYGRQLPYPSETVFGTHLRLFNYGEKSYVREYNDKKKYGIKTAFLSDSFAAYKTSALKEIGYFKDGLILGEDMFAGAKLLKAGYSLAYNENAKVYHSHSYTIFQDFKRYFDIGVFHRCERWILDEFGKPESEGLKYIKSEIRFILKTRKVYLFVSFLFRILAKYTGYKLGYNFRNLPISLVKRFSMHKKWWDKHK